MSCVYFDVSTRWTKHALRRLVPCSASVYQQLKPQTPRPSRIQLRQDLVCRCLPCSRIQDLFVGVAGNRKVVWSALCNRLHGQQCRHRKGRTQQQPDQFRFSNATFFSDLKAATGAWNVSTVWFFVCLFFICHRESELRHDNARDFVYCMA